jgi:hypothetical protein
MHHTALSPARTEEPGTASGLAMPRTARHAPRQLASISFPFLSSGKRSSLTAVTAHCTLCLGKVHHRCILKNSLTWRGVGHTRSRQAATAGCAPLRCCSCSCSLYATHTQSHTQQGTQQGTQHTNLLQDTRSMGATLASPHTAWPAHRYMLNQHTCILHTAYLAAHDTCRVGCGWGRGSNSRLGPLGAGRKAGR